MHLLLIIVGPRTSKDVCTRCHYHRGRPSLPPWVSGKDNYDLISNPELYSGPRLRSWGPKLRTWNVFMSTTPLKEDEQGHHLHQCTELPKRRKSHGEPARVSDPKKERSPVTLSDVTKLPFTLSHFPDVKFSNISLFLWVDINFSRFKSFISSH